MTERRERRRDQTLDLLNAWAGVGAFTRLLFVAAIIAAFVWLVKWGIELVLWFKLLG